MSGGDAAKELEGVRPDAVRASMRSVVTSDMRPLSGPPDVVRRSGPLLGVEGKRGPAKGRRRYPYEAQGMGHWDLAMGRVTAQG